MNLKKFLILTIIPLVFSTNSLLAQPNPKGRLNYDFLKSKKSSKSSSSKTITKKYSPHTEISGLANNNSRRIGLLNLFVPLKQSSNSLFFTDLRLQKDNQSTNEYNIGLGYRVLKEDRILGTYLYYDRRRSKSDTMFNALTLGGERLGKTYDARFNVYIPEDEEGFINNSDSASIQNSKIQVSYQTEKPLIGTDFEIGRRIPLLENTRAFLGANYYFKDEEDNTTYSELWAATSRFETKFFSDRLALGTTLSYNQDSNWDLNAYARFRIAFGGNYSNLSYMERRMTDTVIRDLDIISNSQTTTTSEDISINGVTMDDVSEIDITNDTDVHTQITNAGSNRLVILSGTSGSVTGTITPEENQTIMSGNASTTVSYNTPFGTKTTTLALFGSDATVNFDGNTDAISFTNDSNNSSVIGLNFGSSVRIGIHVSNTSNITAYTDDLAFENIDSYIMQLVGNSSTTINIGNIQSSSQDGISVEVNNSNLSLTIGSMITGDNSRGQLIYYDNNSGGNTINIGSIKVNNNISDLIIGYYGSDSNNSLKIADINVGGNSSSAIDFGSAGNNNTITIDNFTVSGTTPFSNQPEIYVNSSSLNTSENSITITSRNVEHGGAIANNFTDDSDDNVSVTVEGVEID